MTRRVVVYAGDGVTLLGEGEYLGNVTVQAWYRPDGSLVSFTDAERQPTDEELAALAAARCVSTVIHDNPKIRLDDGQVVYGCQVWWQDIAPAPGPIRAESGLWPSG